MKAYVEDVALRKRNPFMTAEANEWQIDAKDLSIVREVGSGSMGTVYEGTWKGMVVAIKRLSERSLSDEKMVDLFARECNLMAVMHHPNVLLFVGTVINPTLRQMLIVTEFCEHGNLHSYLHSRATMNWKRRFEFGTDIARGMLYIHEKAGIIQRDLKSDNVLVAENYRLKVSPYLYHPSIY